MKGFMKKIMDVVKSKNFLIFVAALVVAAVSINHVGSRKNNVTSGMQNKEPTQPTESGFVGATDEDLDNELNPGVVGAEQPSNMNAEDAASLLPAPSASEDDNGDPAAVFLNNRNLVSTFQIPMQTQTLRNANLQVRSEPPNPQNEVCAWNQSTIGPDQYRRSLEICNE